jgi:hypothetical protein
VAVRRDLGGHHAARDDAAEVHRRADVERAEVVGAQLELPPGRSEVIGGGVSRPSKSRFSAFDLPGSLPMYEPASSVPRPEIWPPGDARAHHPEARVLDEEAVGGVAVDLRGHDHGLVVGDKPTDFTVPMSTALCLILVLLASMPSPERKRMVIVGPCSQMFFKRDEAAHERRHDRDDPDELQRPRARLARDRLRDAVVALSHGAHRARPR